MEETQDKRLKIVIVEDEEDILTLYSDYLSSRGYHVIARYTRGNHIKSDLENIRQMSISLTQDYQGEKAELR